MAAKLTDFNVEAVRERAVIKSHAQQAVEEPASLHELPTTKRNLTLNPNTTTYHADTDIGQGEARSRAPISLTG
jgi:hypothetical protein